MTHQRLGSQRVILEEAGEIGMDRKLVAEEVYRKLKAPKRCCENCIHFNPADDTCLEGGFSEIGNPTYELSEEGCSAFLATIFPNIKLA